jgi:hypothetical protein
LILVVVSFAVQKFFKFDTISFLNFHSYFLSNSIQKNITYAYIFKDFPCVFL